CLRPREPFLSRACPSLHVFRGGGWQRGNARRRFCPVRAMRLTLGSKLALDECLRLYLSIRVFELERSRAGTHSRSTQAHRQRGVKPRAIAGAPKTGPKRGLFYCLFSVEAVRRLSG